MSKVILKTVSLTENNTMYLYESGALILRANGSNFGVLVDEDLAAILGDKALKLKADADALRAPKAKPVKVTKRAAEPVKVIQGDHRFDLMQAQMDSLAKANAAILQMLQAQASRPALNVAE